MPVLYLLGGWRDHGGFNSNYANDHQGGHWAAVAAVVLLGVVLVWTLFVDETPAAGRTASLRGVVDRDARELLRAPAVHRRAN